MHETRLRVPGGGGVLLTLAPGGRGFSVSDRETIKGIRHINPTRVEVYEAKKSAGSGPCLPRENCFRIRLSGQATYPCGGFLAWAVAAAMLYSVRPKCHRAVAGDLG